MKFNLNTIIFLIATALLLSCAGGGTSGTGVASVRILSGTVTQSDGQPVENAVVTIQETGESDLTDENGEFEIGTDLVADSYNIQIEGDDLNSTVAVETISEDTQTVQVEIGLDSSNSISSVSSIEVSAKIVGSCKQYFENYPKIHQIVNSDDPLNCKMKYFTSGDLESQEAIVTILEVSSCDALNWTKIATGTTGLGNLAGIGHIAFPFIDDAEHCLYRLSSPVGDKQLKPVEIFIETLTYQQYLENTPILR